MDNDELRLECVKLAQGQHLTLPPIADVVERAKQYADFVLYYEPKANKDIG